MGDLIVKGMLYVSIGCALLGTTTFFYLISTIGINGIISTLFGGGFGQ